ncbi:hypothetical protein LTR08_007480 [Meristemomyces frigidus]|nr:hypothetical protein LTR08_007480 [Meristemomyces frigidus]
MCTQQLIWCACGHGEFLPIEKCSRAVSLGYCWTVVWGDSAVVIPGRCSYCKAGLNERKPLGKALPGGGGGAGVDGAGVVAPAGVDPALLTALPFRPKQWGVRDVAAGGQASSQAMGVSGLDAALVSRTPKLDVEMADMGAGFPMAEGATGLLTPPLELDDVLNTDFSADFDLSQELWQYA